jgi:hypothetical protein
MASAWSHSAFHPGKHQRSPRSVAPGHASAAPRSRFRHIAERATPRHFLSGAALRRGSGIRPLADGGEWWSPTLWGCEQWDLIARARTARCSVAAWCVTCCGISGRWWRSMTEQYVELHAASAFSFLEGASQPEELIERAVELEMPAMALLDHNGVYGAARFHTSAKRNNVRAHVGAEIAVSSFGPRLTPPAWLPHQHPPSRAAAAALRVAGRLPESLSAHHAVQDAENKKCEGRGYLRRSAAIRLRPGLPHGWR